MMTIKNINKVIAQSKFEKEIIVIDDFSLMEQENIYKIKARVKLIN